MSILVNNCILIIYNLLIPYLGFQRTFIVSSKTKKMCSKNYVGQIWVSSLPAWFWRGQSKRSVRLRARCGPQSAQRWPLPSGWKRRKRDFFFVPSISLSYLLFPLKGKCKNLAHPAISTVIHDFFYTEKDCLAAHFRQDFERTIPDHAIALVLTCVSTCFSH